MAEKQINVPKSMLKKFLASKGCRVPPEVVDAMEKKFRNWANEIAEKASETCLADKRKTLVETDLD